MSRNYICIGGPVDGEYREMADCCNHMRVSELPPPPAVAYSAENAEPPSKHCAVRAHNYYLAISKRHGFAWVYEDYNGDVK